MLPFALGLLLVFSACDSDDNGGNTPETVFDAYDANSDGAVNFDEFNALLNQEGFFRGSDADGSDNFSEEEFNNIALFAFDPNEDGIDEGEFETGAELFFGSENDQEFSDYDENESGIIEEGEFTDSFGETGLFEEFDTSGDGDTLSRTELAQGLFELIDDDGNGALSESEFNDGVGTLFGTELPQ